MDQPSRLWVLAVALGLALPPILLAQEPEDQPEASDAEASGMPRYTGRGSVSEAVDSDRGAIYDIGGGMTLLLPVGLPIGHSRVLTLRKDNKAPKPADVAPGFQRQGQTVRFDGALNAPGSPIEFALALKKAPVKRGFRFVLAMETAGLCDASNKQNRISSLLCSTWEIVDTTFDGARALARVDHTGGYRLQFGWIPVTTN